MSISLTKNSDKPRSKHLVFTSAGDHSSIRHWLKGEQRFDLWICYYGDEEGRFRDESDFYLARKDGKFSNLHYVYQHWKDILDHYDAIWVADDDIIITGSAIGQLFEIRAKYDLWLLQPAFGLLGKLSHVITRVEPFSLMRYTNFVEMTCPMFRRDKLDDFMTVFDPVMVGWGTDWWFLQITKADTEGKVAIVDGIPCINPYDVFKGGMREVLRLQDTPSRLKIWETMKAKHGIRSDEWEIRECTRIKGAIGVRSFVRSLFAVSANAAYDFARFCKHPGPPLK